MVHNKQNFRIVTVAQMCIWYYNSGTWRVTAGFDVMAGNFLREK